MFYQKLTILFFKGSQNWLSWNYNSPLFGGRKKCVY